MNATQKISKRRLIAFICLLLLPLAAMIFGAVLLSLDVLINFSFAMTFIILPLGFAALLTLIFFLSNIKPVIKDVLSALLTVFFVFAFFIAMGLGLFETLSRHDNQELTERYTEVKAEFPLMPALSDVGDASKVTYCDYFSLQLIFTSDADYLICEYSGSEYQKQVETINETYSFQREKLSASGRSIEPVAEIDGYTFRLLEDIAYPKRLFFIATNDETHEIIYLYFCDDDLDYITSLTDFILDDCGFKHIQ